MAVPDPPKAGHILFLVPCPQDDRDLQPRPASFELDIPLNDLQQLVLRPIRWLKLVAWGLLNCTGQVLDEKNVPLNEDLLLEQLAVPDTYTFLPDQVGNFSLLNFEHVCSHSEHYSASSDSHDSTLPGQEAQLAARDGGVCVFTGGLPIETAHFIPRRLGSHLDELRELAHDRGFAFDHHLGIRNSISLAAGDFHRSWLHKQVFILATDPAFVRKEDIPPPSIPLPTVDIWPGTVEPTGETYILQTLNSVLDARSNLRKYVPFNTSARFASATPAHAPCPRAVNYVYAAAMAELYLRPLPGVDRLLSRLVFAESHPASAQERPPRSRPHTPTDLTPMEKLYLLADAPALRRAERLQQQEDEIRYRRLQEWRAELATSGPSDT